MLAGPPLSQRHSTHPHQNATAPEHTPSTGVQEGWYKIWVEGSLTTDMPSLLSLSGNGTFNYNDTDPVSQREWADQWVSRLSQGVGWFGLTAHDLA